MEMHMRRNVAEELSFQDTSKIERAFLDPNLRAGDFRAWLLEFGRETVLNVVRSDAMLAELGLRGHPALVCRPDIIVPSPGIGASTRVSSQEAWIPCHFGGL